MSQTEESEKSDQNNPSVAQDKDILLLNNDDASDDKVHFTLVKTVIYYR